MRTDAAIQKRLYSRFGYKSWNGEADPSGKRFVITAEQGLGDAIQFCRYVKLLEQRGAHVSFFVPPSLRRLLETLSPSVDLFSSGDALPRADYHCHLSSLPFAFETTVESVPASVPYLKAQAERIERWKGRLGKSGFKVGIAWQGQTGKVDLGRSFLLSEFMEISRLPDIRLISLQKNAGTEQLQELPASMNVEVLGRDFDSGHDGFLDTAAVMENLDLVISSDTAVAHLAGALGRPVWVALKFVPEWRWLLKRSDSPWYPTMRLFRQAAPDQWKSVFRAMETELARKAQGGLPQST